MLILKEKQRKVGGNMLLFSCATTDTKTGYPIIASELSFNMACSYLAETLKRHITRVKGQTINEYVFYEDDEPSYLYDENRGYLMRIDEHANDLVGKVLRFDSQREFI